MRLWQNFQGAKNERADIFFRPVSMGTKRVCNFTKKEAFTARQRAVFEKKGQAKKSRLSELIR